jgi:hypothetical protein
VIVIAVRLSELIQFVYDWVSGCPCHEIIEDMHIRRRSVKSVVLGFNACICSGCRVPELASGFLKDRSCGQCGVTLGMPPIETYNRHKVNQRAQQALATRQMSDHHLPASTLLWHNPSPSPPSPMCTDRKFQTT